MAVRPWQLARERSGVNCELDEEAAAVSVGVGCKAGGGGCAVFWVARIACVHLRW
jgi:hypothetical protein